MSKVHPFARQLIPQSVNKVHPFARQLIPEGGSVVNPFVRKPIPAGVSKVGYIRLSKMLWKLLREGYTFWLKVGWSEYLCE